jgi:hypothetical protein
MGLLDSLLTAQQATFNALTALSGGAPPLPRSPGPLNGALECLGAWISGKPGGEKKQL